MKNKKIILSATTIMLICFTTFATTFVPSPPGNLVQDGTFLEGFSKWNGLIALVANPNAPNGRFGLGGDIYQDLVTIPGQQYSLVFYAAADLYFGPSASISIELNNQTLVSFDTPPYAYAPVHRYDQMHWQDYTYTFTASANTTRLEFNDLNTYDFGLAAVSVVPVPEPASATMLVLGSIAVLAFLRRRNV